MSKENAKLLIVEDDQFLSNIYATAFSKEGFSVIEATTGEDGLEKIKSEKPDVILLDIMLPGEINGLNVLETIKKDEMLEKIPVMILSNLEDDKTISEGLKLGANGYFIKSQSTPDDVVRNIKTLIK